MRCSKNSDVWNMEHGTLDFAEKASCFECSTAAALPHITVLVGDNTNKGGGRSEIKVFTI